MARKTPKQTRAAARKKRGTRKTTRSRRTTKTRAPHVTLPLARPGGARAHGDLANDLVHVFVDDQNLFWGIVNNERGINYRIDFGRLLLAASRDSSGSSRGVKSAYIAGVIPDDDSFWKIASDKGFTVKRGYLGYGSRSKQDDAYLITEIMATIFEEEGPSTLVVVAGDADYVPALEHSLKRGWRNEVAFISHGIASRLVPVVHELRRIESGEIEYYTDW